MQRLPVRIDPVNYDPDKDPLFIGLSVVPYVYIKEEPTGPNAGKVLQPLLNLPEPAPDQYGETKSPTATSGSGGKPEEKSAPQTTKAPAP